MKKITFLGPVGATFSHDAYNLLAEKYRTPKTINEGVGANCLPSSNNEEILGMISEHQGYGTIAMETLAGGRVAETLESFITLLQKFDKDLLPFHIVGAVKMKLHFCLMVQPDKTLESISKIIAHPKALGACKERVLKTNLPTEGTSSNGEAARLVAENPEYRNCAALGPESAAQKYSLKILDKEYEDSEAVTTFFLITPKDHSVSTGENNRALIVCRLKHESGSLVKALQALALENLNLIQIHSVHTKNNSYDFAIEIEVSDQQIYGMKKAMKKFESCVEKHLFFGPFEVLST